jgi:predicted ribosomally synthesized peptide with SipW-like signal peptide
MKKILAKLFHNKKLLYIYGSLILISGLVVGVTYAAFTDKSNVLGATFTVGSVNLQFLSDVTNETDPALYVDELPGPSFTGLTTLWNTYYVLKLVNIGTSKVSLSSHANYETANDPKDLRSDIIVEVLTWEETTPGEMPNENSTLVSLGKKSITKWKTEGIDIGEYDSGKVIPLILRFTAPTLTDTQQGSTGIFDFEFDAIEI